MDKFIYTAFSTVNNLVNNRAVRSNNLANLNVPGFRRDIGAKAMGTAFLQAMETLDTRALAIQTDKTQFSSEQGSLNATGNNLDVSIRGKGFFLVQGIGEPSLSRRADLFVGPDGFLQNGAGKKMLDASRQPIQVPAHREIKVSDSGDVIITPPDAADGETQVVGRIGMTFGGDVELEKDLDGEIRPIDGSFPDVDNEVRLVPGHLESSNVNITEELVNSIEEQRQYEINIKLISSASEVDEGGASLLRMPS